MRNQSNLFFGSSGYQHFEKWLGHNALFFQGLKRQGLEFSGGSFFLKFPRLPLSEIGATMSK
jgi:hypothetical protein